MPAGAPSPGPLRSLHRKSADPRGHTLPDGPGHHTGNVIRALSLVPDEVRGVKDLLAAHYVPMQRFMDMTFHRSLSRAQMELVASRVSALRSCFY